MLHSGICVVDGTNGASSRDSQVRLDQSVSLMDSRLTLNEGGAS
ncbi:polyketide synthase associated papA5 domain protein [Mycobacterium kansasii 732]|nr:polyketide synthase associated papA5 domain protein [Mycobacterium kansasii 732]